MSSPILCTGILFISATETEAAMAETAQDQNYEILTPPDDLRRKVRELTPREAKKFDPIKAAEAALNRLSGHFGSWMINETVTLLRAWETAQTEGMTEETVAPLFQAAHNIKGQALTLGFPLVGRVAASFCHLIETVPSPEKLPLQLTERYVEAIRAMVMEGAKDDDNRTGVELLETLDIVTTDFLKQFSPDTGGNE
ncbi:Hpt domain-containing protein [Roseibium album]|uniref:Hpt domain-containing protein n=1 Tax=Roseibium album TaxID=311410 RepID=UPI001A18D400|nr:Hpt domain-containing protein [Roseibium album]MBG6142774.1 HPt (histidine-containing phosphotransfer) domain-containing protein [Labrenzia sp. EL_142]MBG6158192.1 HPt (histidine-containing phosphotransfer) domain-containing protein [Labrenzia sp. EL_162]MBG6166654.1 HPt (histidine-containing phosphotransfer) domain-containing protein [Labrenzia sp. EL_195]MBG6196796.1 HPt (histidine-containing phosphotransfer) domain-containing protein [Labrenzia sp. EL_159]MBG6206338.1 HPt (histidine-cont